MKKKKNNTTYWSSEIPSNYRLHTTHLFAKVPLNLKLVIWNVGKREKVL